MHLAINQKALNVSISSTALSFSIETLNKLALTNAPKSRRNLIFVLGGNDVMINKPSPNQYLYLHPFFKRTLFYASYKVLYNVLQIKIIGGTEAIKCVAALICVTN